jgi:hypothetical protein
MQAAPPAGTVVGDHTLEVDPIVKFGYLTLTSDAKSLTISFKTAPRGGPVLQLDSVTLDLVHGKIAGSGGGNVAPQTGPQPKSQKPAKAPFKRR